MSKLIERVRPKIRFSWPAHHDEQLSDLRFVRYGLGSKSESILRSSLTEFLERGERTSPERIAERAGAGANTFYRLFKKKSSCFDQLFEECWYEINALLTRKDHVWDFATNYTAERVILEDVETLLMAHRKNLPQRDALEYVMQTSSRAPHLSSEDLVSAEQEDYENRLLALGSVVIVQNALVGVTEHMIMNFVFTTVRTTITTWSVPGGGVLKLEHVLEHVRSYLRGDSDFDTVDAPTGGSFVALGA